MIDVHFVTKCALKVEPITWNIRVDATLTFEDGYTLLLYSIVEYTKPQNNSLRMWIWEDSRFKIQ